ncbi:hypothetical protein J2Y67_005678 [Neobacillus niacini]|nr:hypothetical protein [Neobacillus niacini]
MGKDKVSLVINILILIALVYIGVKLNDISGLLSDIVLQGNR